VAKRQIRYSSADIISKKFPDICDKKVNIVLAKGNILFVTLHALEDNQLIASDMRANKMKIALDNVSEIILDFKN